MKKTNRHPNHPKLFTVRTLALCLILSLMLLSFVSCGSKKGVPDNFAIESVSECDYVTRRYPSTTEVIHNKFDSESHLDYVTIVSKSEGAYGYFVSSCDAVFQHDRSSDLWSLFNVGEWTEPEYTFNNELVGSYDVVEEYEEDNLSCHIDILKVTKQEIELYYDISADINVDVGFMAYEKLHIESSGRKTIANGEFYTDILDYNPYLKIDIELPEGYLDYSGANYGESYISLRIELDLTNGIKHAHLQDNVELEK